MLLSPIGARINLLNYNFFYSVPYMGVNGLSKFLKNPKLSFLGLLLFGGIFVLDLSATCCYSADLFVSAWKMICHRSVVVAQP